MRCVAQRGEEAARLGQALTGPGCQDEALHRTTAPFCTACRHPLYMPEGIEGKLGDFPCYDPAKVCVTLQADCVLTPEEVGDAKAPLCTHESKSQRGYRRSRPPWKSLAPCACASRRGARTCAAVQPAAAPPLHLHLHLHFKSPWCTPQDLVIPAFTSANKYPQSPLLGAPARQRNILGFFKGGRRWGGGQA